MYRCDIIVIDLSGRRRDTIAGHCYRIWLLPHKVYFCMDTDILFCVRTVYEDIDTLCCHIGNRDIIFRDDLCRIGLIIILDGRIDDGFENNIVHSCGKNREMFFVTLLTLYPALLRIANFLYNSRNTIPLFLFSYKNEVYLDFLRASLYFLYVSLYCWIFYY